MPDHTTTAALARTPADLVDWLFRAENFPDGAWLSTGTGIVPPDDFTLRVGDAVTVTVDGVATTTNRVDSGRRVWDFLGARCPRNRASSWVDQRKHLATSRCPRRISAIFQLVRAARHAEPCEIVKATVA